MDLIKYNVIVQESAELDIDGIVEYISYGLQERRLALKLYRRLSNSIFFSENYAWKMQNN